MQINLTGHHVEITPSLREYVTTKFDKLERFFLIRLIVSM